MDLELGQESKSAGRGASLSSADGFDKSRVCYLVDSLFLAQGLHGKNLCKAEIHFQVIWVRGTHVVKHSEQQVSTPKG